MIQLKDLDTGIIELSDEKLNEVNGGAIALGASAGALSSIGGFSPDIPKSPSAREFLGSTFIGGLFPALGIAATVASGGTVPLFAGAASLKD
jgi:hypothetical protein